MNRYPDIYIRSKNELAKRLAPNKFSYTETLELINDVMYHFNEYWRDNKSQSEQEKDKYVRSAKHTPLGCLLDKINRIVLSRYDKLIPNFIFGGLNGLNHVKACEYLLGNKRKRYLLKMDIRRFFEQISYDRVYYFFLTRCSCSKKASRIFADLCTVPLGPKGSKEPNKSIARGFATSSRLAVWCNLDTFIAIDRLIKKRLKGRDARLAIYVDDIGITACRISKEEMVQLSTEIEDLLLNFDKNQSLPINTNKTKVISHEEGIEHLGLRLNRNTLSLGSKTFAKINSVKSKLTREISNDERKKFQDKQKSLRRYKRYIESI